MWRRLLVPVIPLLLTACSEGEEGTRTIVASVYPLAFAAEQLTGPEWTVIDLTPPGVEAHDLELSLDQRSAIEGAAVVLYVGELGFQPQVEAAVEEARGEVIEATLGGSLRLIDNDPHLWLDPIYLGHLAETLATTLDELDPEREPNYLEGNGPLARRLFELRDLFEETLGDCRYRTIIVSHEAYAYMTRGFELRQFGLTGLTPEAEPTAERLAQARELIDSGEAGAVFYENHADAQRIAEAFAADAGVPAVPLSTLESRPAEGDYFTVMEDNLESLREGLGCR